jgi:hypothetical protein
MKQVRDEHPVRYNEIGYKKRMRTEVGGGDKCECALIPAANFTVFLLYLIRAAAPGKRW